MLITHPLVLVLGAAFAASGLLVVGASGYLLVLSVAAFFYRDVPDPSSTPMSRVTVLVPAHNEADFIARCLSSLAEQTYPRWLYEIVVVADNCTDDTAEIAARAADSVMVRDEPDKIGKGRALRWGMDRILARPDPPDAVVVVDADSIAGSDLLAGLVEHFERGADAVQAEYLMLEETHSTRADLRSGAILLFHRVRFAGRAALGLPCSLVGNGMLLSRRLLDTHPWSAFTSAEDLEYSVDLRLAGVRTVFAGSAQVRSPMPTSARAARQQRQRWEGGRLYVMRTRLPTLLGAIGSRREVGLLDAAVDLAVPPLGILALAGLAGTAVATALVVTSSAPAWVTFPWIASLATIVVFVLAGFRAGGASPSVYRALLHTPAFLMGKAFGTVHVLRGGRGRSWVRTERPSDVSRQDKTVRVGGVPIDWINMDSAISRIMTAAQAGSFLQVCTVNLDFLVNAQRDQEVRTILCEDTVNLPDGAPVVWLGRLRGVRGGVRTAGADLVPGLVERAALEGTRVFFLGGERGAARNAADRLLLNYPNLQISIYEPPRSLLGAMDDEEIFRRLEEARPGLLLVAFGHPKQDKWIHAHRDRLPMVAIGVGCSLDIIAGQRGRAPKWMQQAGLEWAYRVCHEPRRLARRYAIDFVWLITFFLPVELYRRTVAGAG